MNRLLQFVAVFAVGFVLAGGAVLAAGAVGTSGDQPLSSESDADTDYWSAPDTSLESAQPSGNINVETSVDNATVVVHAPPSFRGLGSRGFVAPTSDVGVSREVGPLITALTTAEQTVQIYSGDGRSGPGLASALSNADGFVTTAPESLSAEDRTAVTDFVDSGGHAVIGADPGSAGSISGLTSAMDTAVEPGFLYNMDTNDINYLNVFVEPSARADTNLTAGVDRAVFRGTTSVEPSSGMPGMTTVGDTERSITGQTGQFGVAAMTDNAVILGDSGFMSPEFATRADNNVLIGNLGEFLVADANEPAPQTNVSVNETAVIDAAQAYYEALDAGNVDAAEAAVHSNGEVTVPETFSDAVKNASIELRSPTVTETREGQAFVEGEQVTDPVDGELTTIPVRIELQREDGEWAVWARTIQRG
jgi:hypothetical protein